MSVVSRMLESPGRLHDKIVVNTSTIHPDTTKHIFAALRGAGAKLVMGMYDVRECTKLRRDAYPKQRLYLVPLQWQKAENFSSP